MQVVHNEFVHQLSWFFHLLAYAEDVLSIPSDDAATQSSIIAAATAKQRLSQSSNVQSNATAADIPEQRTRHKLKKKMNNYTPEQQEAISQFMSSAQSKSDGNTKEDWKKLVEVMKEFNRKRYGEQLARIMSVNRDGDGVKQNGTDDGGRGGVAVLLPPVVLPVILVGPLALVLCPFCNPHPPPPPPRPRPRLPLLHYYFYDYYFYFYYYL